MTPDTSHLRKSCPDLAAIIKEAKRERAQLLALRSNKREELSQSDFQTAQTQQLHLDLLRLSLDKIPAMVWLKRIPDGLMLVCNTSAAEMGGTTRGKMEGTLPEKWWPTHFTKRWLIDDNEVAATGRSKVNYLERIVHPRSGQIRWLRTSKFPVLEDNGRVGAVLVFSYDVTDILPPEMREAA
jgi:PAS domain S-box-containing protein